MGNFNRKMGWAKPALIAEGYYPGGASGERFAEALQYGNHP
jgi:hypothetical protein